MTDSNIKHLQENATLYHSAQRATDTFRRQLHRNVSALGKQGYDSETLAKESGLPIGVVNKIIDS